MDAAERVMVVEDDAAVRRAVVRYLTETGYAVSSFDNGVAALAALERELPDLMVVDRMLPGRSGDEIVRDARSRGDMPIIMLTALTDVDSRVEGLELGADDYVTKPFSLRELTLRIRAQLRRAHAATEQPATFRSGEFAIDPARHRVWLRGEEILLSGREYELMLFLMQHPHEVHSRDRLMQEVWGWGFGDASTVTVHVRRLREKIETDPSAPRYLRTVWGAGYEFVPDGAES
ncbi:response regulator transcription factor [Microbacterium sp. GXS0129]|uniref:response regulator transcription factor n=1 Tax=Microbacterium sp. GXS0129 TaxID=3377836 RepID=UPI00383B42C3